MLINATAGTKREPMTVQDKKETANWLAQFRSKLQGYSEQGRYETLSV